jgi:hypothetical protein
LIGERKGATAITTTWAREEKIPRIPLSLSTVAIDTLATVCGQDNGTKMYNLGCASVN